MEEINHYITSDLYLAAFLKTKGFLYKIEKNKNRYEFSFVIDDNLFNNINDYLSGSAVCDPLSFTNNIKNIKNYLYNKK